MPADWCTVNLLILPNIADITTAATEPIAPGYYSVLPILLSITNITQYKSTRFVYLVIFINFTNYNIYNITQLRRWYLISILLNITNITKYFYSILLNIPGANPRNCVFQCNMSIFLNIIIKTAQK